MWHFSNKKLYQNPQFEQYKQWASEQVCCDCGAKASDGNVIDGLWATETQCFSCFSKFGCPENRGLPSSRDLANQSNIDI